MGTERRTELEKKFPEAYRKARIVGGIGGLIGAGLGGYVSALKGSYIYAGLGAGIGIILGHMAGMLIVRRVALRPLVQAEARTNLVLAALSFLMTLAGVIGFFRTGEIIGIVGAIFFALCGVYLVMKYRRGKEN